VLTQGSTDWARTDPFDPGLESGIWSIRFLLVSLSMTPLNTYFGWSSAVRLRKSAGLWSFGFASVHVLYFLSAFPLNWLTWPMHNFILLGLAGMSILTALAVTSNTWSMKRLGKNWKRLHRGVYLAGVAVTTHSLLAAQMSKKLMFRDPQAQHELRIYTAVLCLLLVVRLPVVRQFLLQVPARLQRIWERIASKSGESLPTVQGRESGKSIEPAFLIVPQDVAEKTKEETSSPQPFGANHFADEKTSITLPEEKLPAVERQT
jgi:sulfoxide reductase heme-binding subunit YedZ